MRDDLAPLAVNIVIPQTMMFGIDPIAIALGNPLNVLVREALAGCMVGDSFEMRDPSSGKLHDVFPVELPDRATIHVPLGRAGELGIFAEQRQLVIAVPATVKGMADNALNRQLANGTAAYLGTRQTPPGFVGSVAAYAIRPDPGTQLLVKVFGIQIGFVFP